MLDAKQPMSQTPEPLPPAEHEKAMAELEARLRHLRPEADATEGQPMDETLPAVHSAFND